MAIVKINRVGTTNYTIAETEDKEHVTLNINQIRKIVREHGLKMDDIEIEIIEVE